MAAHHQKWNKAPNKTREHSRTLIDIFIVSFCADVAFQFNFYFLLLLSCFPAHDTINPKQINLSITHLIDRHHCFKFICPVISFTCIILLFSTYKQNVYRVFHICNRFYNKSYTVNIKENSAELGKCMRIYEIKLSVMRMLGSPN